MPNIGCIEDYPVIEEAIQFGVNAYGKPGVMAIQFATFWIEGWLAARKDTISDRDANIIRQGVQNYIFI